MGCSTELRVTDDMKKEIKAFFNETKMPVYERSMPKYRREHPDRDYSVNRAERRKRDKKRGKR